MAGGSGERFWPVSRRDRPKQLLRLASASQTMLEQAVERIVPLIQREDIYVVTGEHLVDAIREADIGIPDANVLAEPCKRNTAGCLAYAAAHLLATRGGDGHTLSMAVLTADHVIGEAQRFRETVDAALSAAESGGVLATHGVVPSHPDTAYGYIQADEAKGPVDAAAPTPIYPVSAFHEKPDRETAAGYLDSGNFYWNSGMFFWRVDVFLSELERARPDLAAATRDMAEAMREDNEARVREIFEGIESVSIDYALMEKASKVVMARADYPWDDVGSWNSLDRTRDHDARGNVVEGDAIVVDSDDCIVYSDVNAEDTAVCVVGLRDLVVVVSKDGVLVIPKDRAQDVREAVEILKKRGSKQI